MEMGPDSAQTNSLARLPHRNDVGFGATNQAFRNGGVVPKRTLYPQMSWTYLHHNRDASAVH